MTTCPTCSKPLGNDRFCIGPLTAPHPAVYPRRLEISYDDGVASSLWVSDRWVRLRPGSAASTPASPRSWDDRDTAQVGAWADRWGAHLPGMWPHRKAV